MSRYIDAEILPTLFNEKFKETQKLIEAGETQLDNLAEGFAEAEKIVLFKAPTADVQEVKHGHWARLGWGEWLEEAKEALEKQIPKKPTFGCEGHDDRGNTIYGIWICPCCEDRYETYDERHNHCPTCGQAIDWSDENGK